MFRFSLILLVGIATMLLPNIAYGQQSAAASDQTYLDFQVETTVRIKTAVSPVYPESLRSARVEGQVIVQFVVDERGQAQMNTFKVLKSNDSRFSDAVKTAVSAMQFHPAQMNGTKVKQLVQQPFRFTAPSVASK
jgi:periplasmic protein TonB